MHKVYFTAGNGSSIDSSFLENLRKHQLEAIEAEPASMEEFIQTVQDASAVIIGMEKMTGEVMDQLPSLRIISRRGVGVDNVDLEAAARRGITVTRTTGTVEQAVAELTVAYMLHFARLLGELDRNMKRGEWKKRPASGLSGAVLGLVGFGGIGQRVAEMVRPFGVRVVYYSRTRKEHLEKELQVSYLPLEELLAVSDYVSLHLPLTAETTHFFHKNLIKKMKSSAILINTARGAVVKEEDLVYALEQKWIAGAAVDVFETEPTVDSKLRAFDNVILTPHVGTFTKDTFQAMNNMAAQNVIDYFYGTVPSQNIARD